MLNDQIGKCQLVSGFAMAFILIYPEAYGCKHLMVFLTCMQVLACGRIESIDRKTIHRLLLDRCIFRFYFMI